MTSAIHEPVRRLIERGVHVPSPETVVVGPEVDPLRIFPGATLLPGVRLLGAETLILPGAVLGAEGPVTVTDCQIGPDVTLRGGFFQRAVFLEGASAGLGAHVREGTILEEGASVAHTVGLKQTILFPFVTLGSLVNFCDVLMAGGTSRKNHGEVGSSYIHFNYTPNQDKATASLLGDVPRGVRLDQPPIFLGGQGGLVGPIRLAFGTVIAAGSVQRKDELRPGRLLGGGAPRPLSVPFSAGVYRNIGRLVSHNLVYIGNLAALSAWYRHARSLFLSDRFPAALLEGLQRNLERGLAERIKRLGQVAGKMAESMQRYVAEGGDPESPLIRQKRAFSERWPEIEAILAEAGRRDGATESRERFLEALSERLGRGGAVYTEVMPTLPPEVRETATEWLEGIVRDVHSAALDSLETFRPRGGTQAGRREGASRTGNEPDGIGRGTGIRNQCAAKGQGNPRRKGLQGQSMGKLFGTDGIRGVANRPPMTAEMALNVGRAVVALYRNGDAPPRVVIGQDTRISGEMLEHALAAGICAMGGDAWLTDVLPTPGVAFLAAATGADAGLVISASHNPFEDNGIKVFRGDGFKLSDEREAELEALILGGGLMARSENVRDTGHVRLFQDARKRYRDFLRSTLGPEASLEGMKIVLDCANGATFQVAPELFAELGAEVTTLFASPDGRNINMGCGSQHPETLMKTVVETGADIGLAFDGDGDRLIAVDETGRRITGDQILAVCARHMQAAGKLPGDLVVATVMSNIGLRLALRKLGVEVRITDVGDRYVLEEMKASGAALGGEDSGHMIFLDHHTTGDGILTALRLIEAARDAGQPLSELAGIMDVFPQLLINVPVREKPEIMDIAPVAEAVRNAEAELGEKGRVLVRYSGTQNLCRIMAEGPTAEIIRDVCDRIATAVRKEIGE